MNITTCQNFGWQLSAQDTHNKLILIVVVVAHNKEHIYTNTAVTAILDSFKQSGVMKGSAYIYILYYEGNKIYKL